MGRLLDWIDEITGYDRSGARVLLVIVAISAVLIAFAVWPVVDDRIFGPECDAACQEAADRLIDEEVPELSQTPTPFNPDEFIDDTLND